MVDDGGQFLPTAVVAAQAQSDTYKNVYDGWKWWHVYCYRCHGVDAVGTTNAPNLTDPNEKLSSAEFLKIVTNGVPDKGMQAWDKLLDDKQITRSSCTFERGPRSYCRQVGQTKSGPTTVRGRPQPDGLAVNATPARASCTCFIYMSRHRVGSTVHDLERIDVSHFSRKGSFLSGRNRQASCHSYEQEDQHVEEAYYHFRVGGACRSGKWRQCVHEHVRQADVLHIQPASGSSGSNAPGRNVHVPFG